MPLDIQRAVDDDIDRILDIQFAAFEPDFFNRLLFTFPISPAAKAPFVEWARRDIKDPTITYMKAVDTERDNEIVAFAKWHIYKQERPESEWNKAEEREWGEGVNVELANEFFGKMQDGRRRNMGGKPYCLLGILDTHPDHQRRGAGARLVQWGTDVADEAHIPCYLSASPNGYPLYKKKGFEDVDLMEIDLSKWGHGIYRQVFMLRPAKER